MVDIVSAFWNVPMHSRYRDLLGFELDGRTFKFIRLPFGWNWSPLICQGTSSLIDSVAQQAGAYAMSAFVDDHQPGDNTPEGCLVSTMLLIVSAELLGVHISYKKLVCICKDDYVYKGLRYHNDGENVTVALEIVRASCRERV